MSDPSYEQRRTDWQIADKYHRDTLGPIRAKADRIVDHTVEYGRLALRTALELNGGGIIALPSLGTLFGSIWNHGHLLPVIGVLAFLFGLAMAAVGYACSFFHFMAWQTVYGELYRRKDRILGEQSTATQEGRVPPKDENKATEKETKYTKRADQWQAVAIFAAVLSLVGFIAGASITAYVLAIPGDVGGGR